MKFSTRAVIGGVGTAILCAAFSPITVIAVPAYVLACVAGKQRDKRLEDSSDSSESGGYEMDSIVRRSYENPVFRRSCVDSPPYVDFSNLMSAEASLARNHPRLAASILSRQIDASIMETGIDALRDITTSALDSGRDFSKIRVRTKQKEKFFGLTVRTYTFDGKVNIR